MENVMGRQSTRPPLILSHETSRYLMMVAFSPREPLPRVARAKVLLAYASGSGISVISKNFQMNRPRIARIIDQALRMGIYESLEERRGRRERDPRSA